MPAALKTIGNSGQIALGKRHAGKPVLVDELEPGVWMIKVAQVIPENERWLHQPEARRRFDAAVRWAEEHPDAASTDPDRELDELARRIEE